MTSQINNQLAKTQNELTKTKVELAELKAEYEEFSYIISHDLSAPLRQIGGFAEIIFTKHAGDFDDKTKRYFDLIFKGTDQSRSILDGLVSYSRINTKNEPFVALNLNSIITKIKEKLSSLITESAAIITCENMPTITGDETQITQVFYHLIHNALHYQLPENKPVISINVIEIVGGWQFCITDNGIGVSENVAEKIFKVLRRGVTNKKYSGIGIGLPITKKILERHQGHIWLESEKGLGSSFYFTIANNFPHE